MGLTSGIWHRVPSCKQVKVRRVNAEVRFRKYQQIAHLLTPPTLVRHCADGSVFTLTPSVARKSRKAKAA